MWKRGECERVKVEKGNDNVRNVGFIHTHPARAGSFDFPKDIRPILAFQNLSINEN
jgi:hypothetical protein